MRTTLVIFALFAFLGIAAAWALFAWLSLDDVQMSGHGYAAMILGIVFSLGLGFGLMGLMFYSSRHGYDEPLTARIKCQLNAKGRSPKRAPLFASVAKQCIDRLLHP